MLLKSLYFILSICGSWIKIEIQVTFLQFTFCFPWFYKYLLNINDIQETIGVFVLMELEELVVALRSSKQDKYQILLI